ncbi:unnamed protein product [Staurois parvus]|uniref:Uncharacterized protein n=1 Tax=Staurois parvus TaxID=386267 RepID=A0ABN9BBZ0_9NEOB|nr:unnamed protein product [Staurois parvus]
MKLLSSSVCLQDRPALVLQRWILHISTETEHVPMDMILTQIASYLLMNIAALMLLLALLIVRMKKLKQSSSGSQPALKTMSVGRCIVHLKWIQYQITLNHTGLLTA